MSSVEFQRGDDQPSPQPNDNLVKSASELALASEETGSDNQPHKAGIVGTRISIFGPDEFGSFQ